MANKIWILKAIGYFILIDFLVSSVSVAMLVGGANGGGSVLSMEGVISIMPYAAMPVAPLSLGLALQNENPSLSRTLMWIALAIFIPLCLLLLLFTSISA